MAPPLLSVTVDMLGGQHEQRQKFLSCVSGKQKGHVTSRMVPSSLSEGCPVPGMFQVCFLSKIP